MPNYSGIWTLQQQMQAISQNLWGLGNAGQQAYTTAGTYSWVAPAGVTSVSVVCVGAGGIYGAMGSGGMGGTGGGGGGLGYKNNYAVTPGSSYTVVVGARGTNSTTGYGTPGGDSYFVSTGVVKGGGAQNGYYNLSSSSLGPGGNGGTYTGDGGGNGGSGGPGYYNGSIRQYGGGGGAGGYSGNGGNGGYYISNTWPQGVVGTNGAGGGGAGDGQSGGRGGCVGLLGQGQSGVVGPYVYAFPESNQDGSGGTGGNYGAGGGSNSGYPGSDGAVRIIWPGNYRQFPTTNTQDI